jgi:hypothetical protein
MIPVLVCRAVAAAARQGLRRPPIEPFCFGNLCGIEVASPVLRPARDDCRSKPYDLDP